MPIAVVNQVRLHSGFAMMAMPERRRESTKTSIAVDEEYWLALRHPAEVQAAGYALLTTNHPGFADLSDELKSALWKEFRAFVRQGENFYRGASVLPWTSSPLNYYYAFLNLAKAAAASRGFIRAQSTVDPRKLRHGIAAKVFPGNPADRWSLKVQQPDDVFGLLYGISVGTSVAEGSEFEVHGLLHYVPHIQWQMAKSGYGPPPWSACHWIFVKGQVPNELWDVIVIDRAFPVDKLPEVFQALYQEVASEPARAFAWNTLRFHAVQANNLRFLQRAVPVANPAAIPASIRAAAPYLLQEHLPSNEEEVGLYLPYESGGQKIPISDLVAAYGAMYFLSSLVRYNPDYMDRIRESNDAWLIESFVKSVPLHVLRALSTEILGYSLRIVHE